MTDRRHNPAGSGNAGSGAPAGGKSLPPASPFAHDDGSADPALAAALEGYAAGRRSLADVVDALAAARVLVPVFATPEPGGVGGGVERAEPPGHAGERERVASSGVAAVDTGDGRRALPVFTCVASLAAWHPAARPVPAPAPRAALSAVNDGWSVLVVDPAGPATAVVPRPAVWALARGSRWTPAVTGGIVDGAVARAITSAVAGLPHVSGVAAEPGRTAEVAVALRIEAGLDRAGLDRVLAAVTAALAASSLVAERVDGLELRVGRAR